jgi:hypothetical protein
MTAKIQIRFPLIGHGKLLEDGYFDEANSEALSWKPFLDKVKLT